MSLEPEEFVYPVHRTFHDQLHLVVREVRILLFAGTLWSAYPSMKVFDGPIAESQRDDTLSFLG
jgi:hypothetical protein